MEPGSSSISLAQAKTGKSNAWCYRTLAREQGEQEMETKKMSISKAIKLAVKNVSYHGSGMYSISDDTSVWEHTLRAGSNPVLAIRNLRVRYAMDCMYGEDGEVFTQLRSDALSQPGTLREIVKMAISDYEER
jgi:hypothetical protein